MLSASFAQAALGCRAEEVPSWFSRAIAQAGQSNFVSVKGVELHYLSWSPLNSDKPVLLFVHGLRAHAHWWDCIAPFFAEHYRVVALDLSGMGDSGHRSEYPFQIAAADIVGFIEQAGLGPVVAIGHSYGGARVLRACADRPDLFQRLIILDALVVYPEDIPPFDPVKPAQRRFYPDQATALGRYRLMPEQPAALSYIVDHIARHSLVEHEQGLSWKFDPMLPSGVAQEEMAATLLPRVSRPVDFVYGEHSAIVSRAMAERIVSDLPNGRGPISMPDAHHHMMIDQPLALIALLRGLLANGAKNE
ncbi:MULTISPECIES: alpha/beta fold hydrolase [unclassified Pseudomonas]|uniref:alpha/beta fold hydrolase n=1 Tax=unclassified Pseudomonas TaxID=196821 RepID=UPI0018E8F07F|nr:MULTISPECIES: alpha/beta hydrolase [unclassified Pseudomonas]MBJ2303710.1 alpha/beta hydrolase [Pseudomonas sp. MF2846]MBK3490297.1 alpha/beta hydrolase [Pseudomonas sp. MF2857]